MRSLETPVSFERCGVDELQIRRFGKCQSLREAINRLGIPKGSASVMDRISTLRLSKPWIRCPRA